MISLKFRPGFLLIQGLNGNIGYFIPQKLFEDIVKVLPEVKSYNHAMAIVISSALKRINDSQPFFDYAIENELKNKITDYSTQKEILTKELKELVEKGVNDYRSGKIKFRF